MTAPSESSPLRALAEPSPETPRVKLFRGVMMFELALNRFDRGAAVQATEDIIAAFDEMRASLNGELESALSRVERAEADSKRLDWLATKVVNVRDSLRYGSEDRWWESPSEDGDPSRIRERIDGELPTPEAPNVG